jgi:hypothetical protein
LQLLQDLTENISTRNRLRFGTGRNRLSAGHGYLRARRWARGTHPPSKNLAEDIAQSAAFLGRRRRPLRCGSLAGLPISPEIRIPVSTGNIFFRMLESTPENRWA